MRNRLLVSILRAALLALVAILFWRSGMLREFDPTMVRASLPALGVAMGLVAASLLAVSFRLKVLVAGVGGVTVRQAWTANALTLGVNLLVPGRLSELLKPWYLRYAAGVPFSVGLSAVVLERAFDVLFLAALAMTGVLAFGAPRPVVWVVLGAAAVLGLLTMPVLLRMLRAGVDRLMPSGVKLRVAPLLDGLEGVADRRYDAAVWFAGAAGWLLSLAAVWVLLHVALSGALGPRHALAVFVATTAGLAVSVLPGGVGTFEGAAVLTLRSFGVPPAESLALAVLLRLQQAVVPLVALAAALLSDPSLFVSIRRAAAAQGQAVGMDERGDSGGGHD